MEIKDLEINDEYATHHKEMLSFHLYAWLLENKPSDSMIYKEAYWEQGFFMRDTICNLLREFKAEVSVISTHTSKSIKLPVYHIKLNNGVEFILRNNFYDWKVTVISPISLMLDDELFSNTDDIAPCYCEGFENEWVLSNYCKDTNNKKFTVEIYSRYLLYTFFFNILMQVNKKVIKKS